MNDTYIGDTFTIYFPNFDSDPLKIFNGLRCKLLGFKPSLDYVFPHKAQYTGMKPGVYKTIGPAMVKLETDQVISISLNNLIPEGYTFNEDHPKNTNYYINAQKYERVADIPETKCQYGDTILIAKHGVFEEDFITQVVDIWVDITQIVYMVYDNSGETHAVAENMVIDTIERGEVYELVEGNRLHQVLTGATFKYHDRENNDVSLHEIQDL